MSLLRRPLLSALALAVYLVVQIGVAGLHHHTAPKESRSPLAAADKTLCSELSDQDDEQACLLCSVLHLVKPLPAAPPAVAAGNAITDLVFTGPAVSLPRIISSAHSRDPPPVAG